MPRPKSTAKPTQTYAEIVESQLERKQHSTIYKEKSTELSDDRIRQAVGQSLKQLIEGVDTEPITITDTKAVKAVTLKYFAACEETSTIPTMNGFAGAMGMSTKAVYDFLKRSPNAESSKWIERVKDCMSDILEQGSLRNNVNGIVSIFLLKAKFGYQDRQAIDLTATASSSPLDTLPDITDVENKYADFMKAMQDDAERLG